MKEFDGFHKDVFTFFNELSKNNNKEWFDKNRDFYEKEIRDQSKLYVGKMNELFSQTNLPYIADNKTSLFRINRDIRFSTNKEPYKTNIGVFFPLKVNVDNIKKLASGVYMHYQPNACMAATGMHNPEPALLKLLRKKISENWYDFESLIEDKLFNEQFPKLWTDGNDLKVVRGYRESDPAFKFLKKKDITYYCDIQQEVFYTEELVSVTLKKAIASRDFSIFLNDILLEL